MQLAIVTDWLSTYGGAENVIAEFHRLWPSAPLFTTVADRAKLRALGDADIRVTALQPWYRVLKRYQFLLPWMPRALEDLDLKNYDVILSSSHAVAKGIISPATAIHICYCHTPMRYAWEMEETYLRDFHIPKMLRPPVKRLLSELRRWDLTTAKRVDLFIANSRETQQRIERIYARESEVVIPPVTDRFFASPLTPASRRSSFLAVGRLVPYKRFDLLIKTANVLKLPLRIAGTGQEEAKLKKMAGPTVTFLGYVPDEDLPALYANARAFLFPPYEDAGIVPLEAQAAGTPVIAYGRGGALDTVKDGVTGVFFAEQTVESLSEAIRKFETLSFDPQAIRKHTEQFSAENFRKRIEKIVERACAFRSMARPDTLS